MTALCNLASVEGTEAKIVIAGAVHVRTTIIVPSPIPPVIHPLIHTHLQASTSLFTAPRIPYR